MERTYLCIDLKSFYASVECVERRLDPMKARLVVADPERSEKTICLAVSPALKAMGIPGRCRVFEIPKSIEYIMAVPRMRLYIDYSAEIYGIYLRYFSSEDMHVYSIDEVFVDVTDYLDLYHMTAKGLAKKIMQEVQEKTGIPSACGIGENLYLAKVALDITAKHAQDHIGILNEQLYREVLGNHIPLTDFWRIGKGTEARLAALGIHTMKEITEADEEILYRMFGLDAELLIDHAWGREPTRMEDIKSYHPKETSVSGGQVLPRDYNFEEGKMIAKEMADLLSLEMAEKGLMTNSVTLHIGYSGHMERSPAHGTRPMPGMTNSSKKIMRCTEQLYEQIVDPYTPVRRISITFHRVSKEAYQQYDLFSDPEEQKKEQYLMKAVLKIRKKYGKNAVLKGMNLQKGATARERNLQIGGHKSGET